MSHHIFWAKMSKYFLPKTKSKVILETTQKSQGHIVKKQQNAFPEKKLLTEYLPECNAEC